MGAGTVAVVGAVCGLVSTVVVLVGVFFTVRQQDREKRRDEEARGQRRLSDLDAARSEGRREVERELRPEINLLRSERDDARRERDLCEREVADVRAELMRRRNGQGG